MARYFFDTSAIVKYFHPEAGPVTVAGMFAEAGRTILLSSLGLIEIRSAFALKVRSGALKQDAARMMRAKLILLGGHSPLWIFFYCVMELPRRAAQGRQTQNAR